MTSLRDTRFDPGPGPSPTLEVRPTEGQVAAFHRDGFTRVPRITTDEELAWLRPLYDFLFEEKRGTFRGGYFDLSRPYESKGNDLVPQVIMPEQRFPQLGCSRVATNNGWRPHRDQVGRPASASRHSCTSRAASPERSSTGLA